MNPLAVAIITALAIVVAVQGIAKRNAEIERDYLAQRANAGWKEARDLHVRVRQLETALANATDAANAANRRAAQAAQSIRNLPALTQGETPVGIHIGPFSVN